MASLQRPLRWANVLLIFLTFLAYLSPYVHPETLWLPAVFGLIYPVLLALNISFVIYWLIRRDRYFLFSLGCIILGWGHFTAFIGPRFSSTGHAMDRADQFRVLSYNIYSFGHYQGSGKRSGPDWPEEELLTFYQEYQPDVWCLQEYPKGSKPAEHYAQLIQQKTPLKYAYFQAGKALALFSRYPLSGVRLEQFTKNNSTNGYLIADLKIGDQSVRIFNIHLQSNAVSRLADEVAENGQLQEKETWLRIRGMLGRYRRTAVMRADQAREIRSMLGASPHPLVLCGDFNDVPLSYAYRQLGQGLIDGFRKKGSGLGTTFRGSLPALRIDYILSSPGIIPISYQVLNTDRSDHYPVLSELQLSQP